MKVLFPTDFSETANNALQYALQFCQKIGARIDLMHVYHLPFTEASNVSYRQIDEMLDEKQAKALQKLVQLAKEAAAEETINQCIPVYGIFLDHEIVDLATVGEYDLIIMGTKGEHSKFEKLLGSVTTRTMMNAPCPVLAIPEDASFKEITRIAYATNFAMGDQQATQQLLKMVEMLQAQLHYVHIEKRKGVLGNSNQIHIDDYPSPFTDFTLIKNDSILLGLDQFIQSQKIDLLTLFIPERRLWERLFHSSFSQKMTFHTKVPLLVFHE